MICESLWVVMTLASLHLTPAGENQQNLGAGVECGSFEGGFYRNSEDRASLYGGVHYFPIRYGDVALGVRADLVTGYRVMGLLPAGGLVAEYTHGPMGGEVTFIPDPLNIRRSVFGFQLKVRIS